MKLAITLTTASALSLIMLGNVWAGDRAQNLTPMFGDVHATAGDEVVIPFIKFNDVSPADGYPETINFSFKVFTAGTNTLLRQTQVKTIPTPAIPGGCTPTQAADELDLGFSVTRRGAQLNSSAVLQAANKRITIAGNMNVWCNNNETLTSFVYSADLSGTETGGVTPGPAWFKSWPGRMVEGLNGVDVDNDLVNDFQMITTGGPTLTGGWNFVMVYAAGKTGAVNTTITPSAGGSYTLPTSGIVYVVNP